MSEPGESSRVKPTESSQSKENSFAKVPEGFKGSASKGFTIPDKVIKEMSDIKKKTEGMTPLPKKEDETPKKSEQ